MAAIKVTDEDLKLLEIKSDFAYETLRRAIEIPEPLLIQSAECLYHHDLGDFLFRLTHRATEDFTKLNKGGSRARKIEGFIIQYVLMVGKSHDGDSFQLDIKHNSEDNFGGLVAFLETTDNMGSEEGEVFRLIQKRAGELREANQYPAILRAREYVRQKYP